LAQRFQGPAPRDVGRLAARLTLDHPAPLGGLVRLSAGAWLVSASPERFLRVRGRDVITRPIKGTAPRGATEAEDARFRAELLASGKERAELAMIVDLLRNDLAATAAPGSVVVREPFALESHPTVHHLTATVASVLAPDQDAFDLVRAAWPGGSISGCPKIRAATLIDELEAFRRGPYTGSLAAFSADGRVDLNLLIRSLLVVDGVATLWGGGGITIASDPEAERRETLQKIRGLARALHWEPPT
jgi:para-aminobenzoate synthetase component 1